MIKAYKQFRHVARLSKLNWAVTFVAYCLHVQDINPDYKLDYPINVFFEQNGRSTAIYYLKRGTVQIIQFFVTWINCQVHFLTRDMSHSMKVNVSAQADYPHVGQDHQF